jgi:flagella basal body P-ring formation protein FlgA
MPMLPLLLIALQAAPPAYEDLAALEARVVAAAGANIGEAGGPVHGIDRRLRLHRCPVAADIVPARSGFSAACPTLGWRVHIAVSNGGADGGRDAAAGNPTMGGPAIRRGDAVLVRITGRGFAAGLRAVAMENGAVGARIRLRPNSSPATPITAIVTGPGEATPAT